MNSESPELTQFLQTYKTQISSKVDLSKLKASILPTTQEGLQKAGEIIRKGELVSFPTETVYGLAANALDEKAVLKIFETKKRPLSDPVIVHVSKAEKALDFLDIDSKSKDLFLYLTSKLWPGPLTCVLKADMTKIPSCVTANTGYVGVRCPKAQIARDFIEACDRPVAAPSANLFSHVSPTSPVHVFNDFYDQNVTVLNGETCEFGIESTVMKIINENGALRLLIFRMGSVSEQQIKSVLRESQDYKEIPIDKFKKDAYVHEDVNSEAPGMLLKHYSPYVETFLLNVESQKPAEATYVTDVNPKEVVLIDFGGALASEKDGYLKYFSLSEKGVLREAMANLYSTLREAENVEGAKLILILNLSVYYEQNKSEVKDLPEFLETVYDKSFRSASGKTVHFDLKEKKFFK